MLCPAMSATLLMLALPGNSSSNLGKMHRSTDVQREETVVEKPCHPEVAISLEEFEKIEYKILREDLHKIKELAENSKIVREDLHKIKELAEKAHQNLKRLRVIAGDYLIFSDRCEPPDRCESPTRRARHYDSEIVIPSGFSLRGEPQEEPQLPKLGNGWLGRWRKKYEVTLRATDFQPSDQHLHKQFANCLCSFKMMLQEEASGGEGSHREVVEQDAFLNC